MSHFDGERGEADVMARAAVDGPSASVRVGQAASLAIRRGSSMPNTIWISL